MTPRKADRTPRSERGYSLVEVLVSAGVLGGVLLSISTMFIAGTQSVRSGRDLTRATTIASSATEDVLTLPYELVYGITGADRSAETSGWTTDDPIPPLSGSMDDVALMTEMLESWREQVQTELAQGRLTYRVDGIVRLPSASDDGLQSYNEATFLRVTIRVEWSETRNRRRHVVFEALAS